MRPLAEIAKLNGKRVRSAMPKHPKASPHEATLDGPCIHPLETVTLE